MKITNEHIRHCILFADNLGKKPPEANEMICQAYGENSVGLTTIKEWFSKFKKGEFDLKDKPRVGRPKETSADDLQALLDEDDSQLRRELDRLLNTILRNLKAMGKVQIGTRWVLHKLTERQKFDRMNICMSLLGRHRKKSFLWRIVTGDEKWVCYENQVRKRRWVDPKTPSSSV